MMYKIGSNQLTVVIDSLGCQLKRITSPEMKEYLWTGDPAVWEDSAPLLFPFIGRLQNQKYIYDNKEYPATIHGFISKREFTLVKQEQEMLVMSFRSTKEDNELYIFPFELMVTFIIANNSLTISFEVRNIGTSTMHFGIGFHPGFNVPLSPISNLVFKDYYLQFQHPAITELHMEKNCLYSGKDTSRQLEHNNSLALRHDLFDNDALIFKNWGSSVSLKEITESQEIRIETNDFPYLTIWHHPHTQDPFICIEPCTSFPGMNKKIVHIAEKEDYIHLAASETYSTKILITFRG
ncbi:MAG: aldose 1-epimerase family protein [Sphaerochaetaceae bacterium]|nr:aldose 1-epimerase family protein [Sphaerochaetaceae bacterium]